MKIIIILKKLKMKKMMKEMKIIMKIIMKSIIIIKLMKLV
jgi:hypothetical protein